MGLLPDFLPFPYPVPGHQTSEGKAFEYRLPVAGVEAAAKLADEAAVESNQMFHYKVREQP
jgi:carboxymethylenebutenolidase